MRLVDVVRLAQYSPKDFEKVSSRILPQLCVQKYKRVPFKRPWQDGFTRASARVSTGVLRLWLSIVSHKNVVRPSQHCLRTCATEVSYGVSFSFPESHTRVTRVQNQLHRSVAQRCPARASWRMILKRVFQKRLKQLPHFCRRARTRVPHFCAQWRNKTTFQERLATTRVFQKSF